MNLYWWNFSLLENQVGKKWFFFQSKGKAWNKQDCYYRYVYGFLLLGVPYGPVTGLDTFLSHNNLQGWHQSPLLTDEETKLQKNYLLTRGHSELDSPLGLTPMPGPLTWQHGHSSVSFMETSNPLWDTKPWPFEERVGQKFQALRNWMLLDEKDQEQVGLSSFFLPCASCCAGYGGRWQEPSGGFSTLVTQ